MAESKSSVGVLNNGTGETHQKSSSTHHPRMPPNPFPIPLPGRNRYSHNTYWGWKQRLTKGTMVNQTGGNSNGSNHDHEQSTVKT